jgi:DNA polymerase elongation subunit (family B)
MAGRTYGGSMSKFYTNVFQRGNKIYVRGYDKGIRTKNIVSYKPYMFVPAAKGDYRTLDGRPVGKMEFDTIYEAREFIGKYSDVSNFNYYGLDRWSYLYIFDTFKGDIDYDPKIIKVGIVDIECASDEGFPNIEAADKPITAISVRCLGRNYAFGCGDFTSDDPNTYYVKCADEREILKQFLDCWEKLDVDIISGWNIEFFDIPYIVNRIRNLFSMQEAARLSPWKMLDEKRVNFRDKEQQSYWPIGIAVLDYMQIYRKFSFGNESSYKLDYIAEKTTGEKKLDYSEHGSLLELYKNNHQKFIEYNIRDVELVDKIDDKMKFVEQILAMAYNAKVNYPDVQSTVLPWDIIIHNYLLEKRIVIPQVDKNKMPASLVGGYVKDPRLGLTKWVVSFDLNSLYPHLIMQYNISPETYVGKVDMPGVEGLLAGNFIADHTDLAHCPNGSVYTKDKQGFFPALMEKMYDDRVKYKKLMLEAKHRYEKNKNSEDEKLISRYHNLQLAKKIQLNSAYGALANEFFRWFSFENAEAITTSGQLTIRWIEKKINAFMNKTLNNNNVADIDYVIASDTDSIYVDMSGFIPNGADEIKAVAALDRYCEKTVQPYLDECFEELAKMMNAYSQKMQMKRETIANKGIWKAKKMYILNAWNVEGVQYEKPKLKLQGIEAVRSSTPIACRTAIMEALHIVMDGTEEDLQQYVMTLHDDFMKMPYDKIAFPRGVRDLQKYSMGGARYKLGTPIHVKASLLYNNLIKTKGYRDLQPIQNGDKIKFVYLKRQNPILDTVIAMPDDLPKEFQWINEYIDRDMQFNKGFLSPLKSITDLINWRTEKTSTLEDFFL